jgi:hypothetical protein
LVHLAGAVLDEGTGGQPNGIAANTERHRLRDGINTAAGAERKPAAQIEDAGVRVNLQAAAKPGKAYKSGILNLERADVTVGFRRSRGGERAAGQ